MNKNEYNPDNSSESDQGVCDLNYLIEMMGGKKELIKGILDTFLAQVSDELQALTTAIAIADYESVKKLAHTMKSTVSIVGIAQLAPILLEMENLGANRTNIEKIKELNQQLNRICKQAIDEIKKENLNYV